MTNLSKSQLAVLNSMDRTVKTFEKKLVKLTEARDLALQRVHEKYNASIEDVEKSIRAIKVGISTLIIPEESSATVENEEKTFPTIEESSEQQASEEFPDEHFPKNFPA